MAEPSLSNLDLELNNIDLNNINDLISDEEFKKIMNEAQDIQNLEINKDIDINLNSNKKNLNNKTKEEQILSEKEIKEISNNINDFLSYKLPQKKIIQNEPSKLNITYPLDYINKYEIKNYENNNIITENIFLLSEYKKTKVNLQFNVMKFSKKQKLFYRINKDKSQITCLYSRNGIIFSGNKEGIIKTFSSEKEYEYKTYKSQELQNIVNMDKSVLCIDCSPNNDVFFTGHGNGFIILWDTIGVNVKKIISNAHDNSVLEIKFVKFNLGFYSILSSDINGKVNLINISEGYFLTSVDINLVINRSSPCYLIKTSYFSEEEKKTYNINEETDNTISVIGNEESIEIFIIDPYSESKKRMIKSIIVLSNPSNKINDNNIKYPDASFGCGYTPYFVDTGINNDDNLNLNEENSNFNNNNLNNNINNNLNDNNYNYVNSKGFNFSQTQVLLALSWFCKITVYAIPIINKKIEFPMLIGYYYNKLPIMRINFFSNSIIYFFDEEKKIKTLNTNVLSLEENINEDTKEGLLIDKNIQSNFQTKNGDKLYYHFIISYPKNIYIYCLNEFYHAKLLSWDECLKNLKENYDWMTMFCLGIDIYKGNIKSLADIPMKEYYRKTRVKYFLNSYLKEYFSININNDKISSFDFINFTIDFCINIESIEFLLNDIRNMLENKGMGNLFFEKLEPFILKNKLNEQFIDQSTLTSIFQYYITKNNLYHLSLIIPHFSLKTLNNDFVKKTCLQYNFSNALIYIYTNVYDDFFFPIKVMFDNFCKCSNIFDYKKEENKNELFYSDSYITKIKNEQFEKSKEYLGHKILWFCNLCVKGQKYPNYNNMNENTYKKIVLQLFLWLISVDVLENFILFDSYSYFKVLEQFFLEQNIFNLISRINNKLFKEICNSINISFTKKGSNIALINEANLNQIIYMIKNLCEESKNILIQIDFYIFVIKISNKVNLEIPLMMKALNFILNYNESIKDKELIDKFKCEYNLINFDNDYLSDLGEYLNDVIDLIKEILDLEENEKIFLEKYLPTLIDSCEKGPFINVKIHLYKLKNDYIKCIEIYLEEKGKDKSIFDFIISNLSELELKDKNNFKKVKEYIKGKIELLANISIDGITKLVIQFFKDDQEEVIRKLDNVPSVQLDYLENIINLYKEDIEKINDNLNMKREFEQILQMQLELLIKLNKTQEILPKLKNDYEYYPLEQSLKVCYKNKITDATIFICRVMKYYKKALILVLEKLNEIYNKLEEIFSNENSIKSYFEEYFNSFKFYINLGHSICQQSNNNRTLWLKLFEYVYSIFQKTKNINNNKFINDINKYVEKEIENVIKNSLCYIGIDKITNYIQTKFNKDESEEFKKISKNIFPKVNEYEKILKSAIKISQHQILDNINTLKESTLKGTKYKMKRCDFCKGKFNKLGKQIIKTFKCGHKIHEKCCYIRINNQNKKMTNKKFDDEDEEENEYVCSICYINDIGGPEVNKKNALFNKLFPHDDEISKSFKIIKKERHLGKLAILDEKFFNTNI